MIITIDGPTASGKSSTARMLAHKLGIMHLNSGLLYRALAYLLVNQHGYDELTIRHVKKDDVLTCLDHDRLVYLYDPAANKASVLYDGCDITPFLMTKNVEMCASLISPLALVREKITDLQRAIGAHASLVIEGRDAGSVVFPYARKKFFLTASLDVRAERWRVERCADCSFEEALSYVQKRDERDTARAISPLIVPQDARIIDTTHLDHEAVCASMLDYIQE